MTVTPAGVPAIKMPGPLGTVGQGEGDGDLGLSTSSTEISLAVPAVNTKFDILNRGRLQGALMVGASLPAVTVIGIARVRCGKRRRRPCAPGRRP